ncbi:MAG: hypothetical protein J7K54_02180 [Candidatus Aenigmarchaeota archaeon]|nr:hypothetical protein [Candidatus Aenigmarchaeota archaeon]
MTHSWKTYDETFHGSKWHLVIVALVILIFLSLIWVIFAALKGYPFAELIPAGSTGMIILIFLLFFALSGKVFISAGSSSAVSLLSNPVSMALVIALVVIAFFLITGMEAWVMFLIVLVIIILTALLSLTGILAVTANLLATLVFAFSIAVYIGIAFLVGSNLPTANIIIAILAFILLVAFFPIAIFLVELFGWEHE